MAPRRARAARLLGQLVTAALWAEKLNRKVWLPISAGITVLGGVIVAAGGDTRIVAFVGAGIIFFGFNLWVPMTYARSAESFPTRARMTGFALVDGVGHLGGGIGVLGIAPLIPKMSVFGACMLVSSFLVVAAVIGMFDVETRKKRFEGHLAVTWGAVSRAASSDLSTLAFATADEWEAWLREHHDSAPGVWIKFARKGSGVASVTYMEALHAALCFGWIDGQARG